MKEAKNEQSQALGVQVAGDHYTELPVQPMYYSECNALSAAQHTAIKYITRQKGDLTRRLEDLDKAIHCVELYKQSLIEDWAGERDATRIRARITKLEQQLRECKEAPVPADVRGERAV